MAIVTPLEWLQSLPKPNIKPGHTLRWLSRYGWNGTIDLDTRVHLCEHWGYALSLGQEVTPALLDRLDDPQSNEARIAAISLQNPTKFPLEVIVDYRMPVPGEVPESTWVHDAQGNRVNYYGEPVTAPVQGNDQPIFSPTAPLSVWEAAGEYRAAPLRELVARGLPIAVILDGGERGLPVWQWGAQSWPNDPAIVADKEASGLDWMDYCSWKKGEVEKIIFDKIKEAVPNAQTITYFGASEGEYRNAWLMDPPYIGDESGSWHRTDIKKFIDLPATTIYFNLYNTGFTGRMDVLTMLTNAQGLQQAQNEPFAYGWLNPDNALPTVDDPLPPGAPMPSPAERPRWIGFMKCWYFLGLIGHVFCYWYFPSQTYNQSFDSDNPPDWWWYMAANSYVHAQFSHLEEFIRNSDLLPGPNPHAVHGSDPSYEFGDSTTRILIRHHRVRQAWLIIAWVSDGEDRYFTVEVPQFGTIRILATVKGSIYRGPLN